MKTLTRRVLLLIVLMAAFSITTQSGTHCLLAGPCAAPTLTLAAAPPAEKAVETAAGSPLLLLIQF